MGLCSTFERNSYTCRTTSREGYALSIKNSWIRRSATWIEYGSVNRVRGVTSPSDSAPATVTILKTDPGSNASLTAWFFCRRAGALGYLFAS
jgi:hypothetical protein